MNQQNLSAKTLTSAAEHHDLTLQLINEAKRSIDIYCHDLTPRIYNHPDIADALTKFIVSNSAGRNIKILVHDISSIISCDHLVLESYRRLTSNFSIHKMSQQHIHHTESFLISDKTNTLFRNDYTRFDGHLVDDPLQTKELLNLFDECWSHSQTDSNLNRVYL